jgi:hypothetical protein
LGLISTSDARWLRREEQLLGYFDR